MREIRNIVSTFDQLLAADECAVLASVVAVNGSTYRRPGARTLIAPDESSIGLVSGGCLESDLILRAREVRADGQPRLVHYDSSEESDIVWGLGLGCAGMVEVLLERVDARHPGPLDLLRDCLGSRHPWVIATPLGADPPHSSATPLGLGGARLGLREGSELTGAAPSESETRWVEKQARDCLAQARTATRRFSDPGSPEDPALRYLFEYVPPALRLLVFGTGIDAVPLTRYATSLGWDVIVVDNRSGKERPDHFAPELPISQLDPRHAQAWFEDTGFDDRSAAVVMTHHYLDDRGILRGLLATNVRYIGLLGPRQRANDLLRDLRADGALDEGDHLESLEFLSRLHAPAGLDLGTDSPEEIALSVVAEIQAVFSGRTAGWLRDRKAPIHDPSPS